MLHRWCLVHNDIKPDNVGLVEAAAGRACLFDFADTLPSGAKSLQRGTAGYCAPETGTAGQVAVTLDYFPLAQTILELLCQDQSVFEEYIECYHTYYQASLKGLSDKEDRTSWARVVIKQDVALGHVDKVYVREALRGLLDREPCRRGTLANLVAALERNKNPTGQTKTSAIGEVQVTCDSNVLQLTEALEKVLPGLVERVLGARLKEIKDLLLEGRNERRGIMGKLDAVESRLTEVHTLT